MENNTNAQPELGDVGSHENFFTSVTPLSKYLALVLFVSLPFVGGWVGYIYAPEKIVEVEKVLYEEKDEIELSQEIDESKNKPVYVAMDDNVRLGEWFFDGGSYAVDHELMLEHAGITDWLEETGFEYGLTVGKLSDQHTLLEIGVEGSIVATLVYNEKTAEIVWNRAVTSGLDQALSKWFAVYNKNNPSSPYVFLIAIEDPFARNTKPKVVIYDFVNNTSEVLYTEEREGKVLAEACERGCEGFIHIDVNQNILIGSYTRTDETYAEYDETILVPVPDKYKSSFVLDSLKNY